MSKTIFKISKGDVVSIFNAFFSASEQKQVTGKELYFLGVNQEYFKGPALAIQKANNSIIKDKLAEARKIGAIDDQDTILNIDLWNKVQKQFEEHNRIAQDLLDEVDEYEVHTIDINNVKMTGREYLILFRFFTGEMKD